MSVNKNIIYLFCIFIMLLMFPLSVSAYSLKETTPITNAFTFVPVYTVTYNNGNYTYTGGTIVLGGDTYTTTINPNNNYSTTGATVTMGGQTVQNAFSGDENGGTITISNVTGNININVTTQQRGGGICLVEGTKVMLADGSTKNIENIKYTDLLRVWNHDKGTYGYEYPAWIEKESVADQYIKVTFSDGSVLKVVGNHSVFSKTLNKYVNVNSDEFHVGDIVVKASNGIRYVIVNNIEIVNERVKYYHVISSRYFNIITNNILTTYEIYNNVSNFMGFGENLKWQITDTVRSDMYTYDDFPYLYKYIFKTFRLQETKYLVENGLVTPAQFQDLFENYLMNEFRKVSPPKDANGNRLWMVTTSDTPDSSNPLHQMIEGSSYTIPVPNNTENFLYWYNHSDNKNYQPGQVIEVDSSIYLEAIYR